MDDIEQAWKQIVQIGVVLAIWAIGSGIGALVLRWSVQIFNSLARQNRRGRVQVPEAEEAIRIVGIALGVDMGFAFVLALVGGHGISGSAASALAPGSGPHSLSLLIAIGLLGWLIYSGISTSPSQAIVITGIFVAIFTFVYMVAQVLLGIVALFVQRDRAVDRMRQL